ncbi:hypothetical protein NDN08_007989 [Rhodosorus marinus]|uniref:Uncharacterized protein n=1 Tax=Rhodosorus marinus TaxID=101924 RepID=A0AAV8V482_9RHOD|nr:hypothetical protein NDN08_007989 [Rhodosorus marinus]
MAFCNTCRVGRVLGPNSTGVARCRRQNRSKNYLTRASLWPRVPLPLEMDQFDRHRFMKGAIEGDVPEALVCNAIVAAMGYVWDDHAEEWRPDKCSTATLERMKTFADFPPNFVGDDQASGFLEEQLPEDEVVRKGIDDYIEVIYGEEITKISREAGDPGYRRLEIACKWLYTYSDFC